MLRFACCAALCATVLVPASAVACDWAPLVYRSHGVTGDLPACLSIEQDDDPGDRYETEGQRIAFRVRNACDEEAWAMLWPTDCPDCEVREVFGQLEYETALFYDDHLGETVSIPLTWQTHDAAGSATLLLELPDERPSEQSNGCDGDGGSRGLGGCSIGGARNGVFGLSLVVLGCFARRRSAAQARSPRPNM